MARTAVTLQKLSKNSSVNSGAGTTADPTNGHIVSAARFRKLFLRATNTDASARVLTVKAGDLNRAGGDPGLGDLAITVGATTGDVLVGPLDGSRFAQANGDLYVDLAASFTGKVWAYQLPDQY